jgi:hypothetical protein
MHSFSYLDHTFINKYHQLAFLWLQVSLIGVEEVKRVLHVFELTCTFLELVLKITHKQRQPSPATICKRLEIWQMNEEK